MLGLGLGLPLKAGATGAGGGPPPPDYVTSWLKFEGAQDSTAFPDAKGRTWQRIGSPYIDRTYPAFGKDPSYFTLFDANSDWLTTTDALSGLNVGSGDWAVQAWVSASGQFTLFDQSGDGFFIGTQSSFNLFIYHNRSGWWPFFDTGFTGIDLHDGQPHYICIQKKGTRLAAWVDTRFIAAYEVEGRDFNYTPSQVHLNARQGNNGSRPNLKRMWGFKLTVGASVHDTEANIVVPSPIN